MRFDDSLKTVLAADAGSTSGAAAAWRQLVDLIGRGRVPDVSEAIERLRDLRARVPAAVRVASARALALTGAPADLVALFAEDDIATAAPVLRAARLDAADWLTLLPALSPAARSILRHRRDLPEAVTRGLESFGATDFVLGHDAPPTAKAAVEEAEENPAPAPASPPAEPRSEIADLVARIDAFRRDKRVVAPVPPPREADDFQFQTDAAGVIRWVEGVARTPLIGIGLATPKPQGAASVDVAAGVAWARRRSFACPLHVTGDSSAAGDWRLTADPRFDRVTGAFTGYAGIGRRTTAVPPAESASDALRQLVHELRTPAGAIAGFAELIGSELSGPVPPVYRDRAVLIHRQGSALTEAIADLDTAARLEGEVLDTRSATVDLAPIAAQAVVELQPVAAARFVRLTLRAPGQTRVEADERGVRRLVERLLAVAVAAAMPGEALYAHIVAKPRSIRLHVTRPRGLAAGSDAALLAIDAGEGEDDLLPLGVGFTLRLIRELAVALGGSLMITPERLTLRLPAAVTAEMERVTTQ